MAEIPLSRRLPQAEERENEAVGLSNSHTSRHLLYDDKIDAFKAWAGPKLLEKAKSREMELRPILRQQTSITFYPLGGLVRINGTDDYEPEERKESKRGKIGGFTAKARGRLMERLASIILTALPTFLTLTWPAVWPADPKKWKRCIDTFWKRVEYRYPQASAIWKLEFQERGAPHYHLLLFGIPFIPCDDIARWWYEVCDSGDTSHLYAGTSIEAIHSRDGVMSYASKGYMGKEVEAHEGVGRFWGILNRKSLPVSPSETVELVVPVLQKFARIARKFIKSQQKARHVWKKKVGRKSRYWKYKCNRPGRIFTKAPGDWIRLAEWAYDNFTADLEKKGLPF